MKKRVTTAIAVTAAAAMTLGLVTACASNDNGGSAATKATEAAAQDAAEAVTQAVTEAAVAASETTEAAPDTISIMIPPVTADYQDKMAEWKTQFETENPGLTLDVINTSWDDHNEKVSTMAQAGEAPDIVELSYSDIGQYVQLGVAVDITQYMAADQLADFDQNAIDYMTLDGATYGLPLYITIQSLGANKDMLTAAGVDVADVQKNGWTFDQFKDAIKNGTDASKEQYGFVFATSNVTASDFLTVFGVSAGLTNAFTADLKYAYTAQNLKTLLEQVEQMVSSGYMPNYGVDAAQRMVMCETGNAMIFGKAMPLFENNINNNNAAIEANDGTAVENSIPVTYSFLPVPVMDGVSETCFGTVDGLVTMKNGNFSEEHEANVMKALYFLCSAERAAYTDAQLCLDPVCQTGRDLIDTIDVPARDQDNIDCAARMIKLVSAPPTGITAEMSTNASQMMQETIAPKFQALLAGETTADQMYQDVCDAAFQLFGEDNCETGEIQ